MLQMFPPPSLSFSSRPPEVVVLHVPTVSSPAALVNPGHTSLPSPDPSTGEEGCSGLAVDAEAAEDKDRTNHQQKLSTVDQV